MVKHASTREAFDRDWPWAAKISALALGVGALTGLVATWLVSGFLRLLSRLAGASSRAASWVAGT